MTREPTKWRRLDDGSYTNMTDEELAAIDATFTREAKLEAEIVRLHAQLRDWDRERQRRNAADIRAAVLDERRRRAITYCDAVRRMLRAVRPFRELSFVQGTREYELREAAGQLRWLHEGFEPQPTPPKEER